MSSAVLAVAPGAAPPAGGELASGRWWPASAIGTEGGPTMAFDHLDIVTSAIERLRARLEHSDLATALVGEPFTIGDLRRVYEAAWGVELEPANFRRKILATPGMLAQTAGRGSSGRAGRPTSTSAVPEPSCTRRCRDRGDRRPGGPETPPCGPSAPDAGGAGPGCRRRRRRAGRRG